MKRLPKYSSCRPDFMAPGPHVHIEKREGLCFEAQKLFTVLTDEDDVTALRYYESDGVLGELYRDIDEVEVFNQIKRSHKSDRIGNDTSIIDAVWKHVQHQCQVIQWEHLRPWAEDLQEM